MFKNIIKMETREQIVKPLDSEFKTSVASFLKFVI